MRTPEINNALERTLTRERLSKYLVRSGNDLDAALCLYERNKRLAESFYVPLQNFEVCLRNCLNEQMAAVYGDDWFDNGNPPLERSTENMIDEAVREAVKTPVLPDDLVAGLRFAFWLNLMGPRYDATLWRRVLFRAFAVRKPRSVVHARFNAIRRFRNRVAHHEPIFHQDLPARHEEIIEAIRWLSPQTADWTCHHSRFEAVYSAPQ